ncbi:MAG TPA: FxLYD domain-containing protein [Candidatus Nitrosotalea sp.]|nr:FxLYD domain-containing protein [Candidatus Nitrosotalea sp.]
MKTLLLSGSLILLLFTTNIVWADLPPSTSLGVEALQTIYSHKANDGTTVVFGEVQNNLNSPVNAVTIGVTFMDDNSNQIEYKTDTTLLQVIPSGGKVPFMISSTKADPSITQIQVKIAGFQSSPERQQVLNISSNPLQVSDKLSVSGTITNNGALKSTNTKIYLISYDAFQRIVAIGISDPISVDSGKDSQFSITSDSSTRAKSYMLIAESDNYQSKLIPVNSVQVTLPVIVSNTVITDLNGTAYSTIPVNASVKITSNAQYIANSTQPFVYYVQVKQFNGKVEFIGKYEGVFLGTGDQSVSVNWTPHSAGSYFIETYVWNFDAIPLSSAVPSINLVLVK